MTTLIEAVYGNGVLKPLVEAGFKEHQRYKVIFGEPATESEDEWFNRNVLGSHGWLNHVRMGLVDYEGKLFLIRTDDAN
jgi:predicted DNA-binding antitoxin AbrB/MazE fold protein